MTGCQKQIGTKIHSLIHKNLGFLVKVILNAQNQSFSESQYPKDQYLVIDSTEKNLQFMGKRMIIGTAINKKVFHCIENRIIRVEYGEYPENHLQLILN